MSIENLDVIIPGGGALFSIEKLHIFQGDRIVVLGANGTGKTQLIKKLNLAITDTDAVKQIKVTPSLVLGCLDQEMSQFNMADTPAELVSQYHCGDAQARSMLASSGFALEKQSRPISELSFGQRTRLGLLVLRLIDPNFYLLDEPTNHVDIPAQERLEDEILRHQATVILISHDRRLVRNIGTRYLQIVRRRLVEVDGPEAFFAEMGQGDL
jgi:ATPase subunit of ABC transporter with duplicated ATPase domains